MQTEHKTCVTSKKQNLQLRFSALLAQWRQKTPCRTFCVLRHDSRWRVWYSVRHGGKNGWSTESDKTAEQVKIFIRSSRKPAIRSSCKIHVSRKNLSTFISVINQLDVQNFCFTITLFHASTCFEHMCSPSGSQNCIHSLWYYHTYRWPSRAREDNL